MPWNPTFSIGPAIGWYDAMLTCALNRWYAVYAAVLVLSNPGHSPYCSIDKKILRLRYIPKLCA